MPGKTYLADSNDHKIYTVETFNHAVTLLEVGVLKTAPLKIIRLRIDVTLPESDVAGEVFHVPPPAAADAKIDEIISRYQRVLDERSAI